MSIKSKKAIQIIVCMIVAITIYTLGNSAATRISPEDMTRSAMMETAGRIEMFMQQNHSLPEALDKLAARPGYMNRIVDGWEQPLIYEIDGNQFALSSLGKDGEVGGVGADADILMQYRLINGAIEEF